MKSVFIISTASQAFFLSLTPELVNNSILILTAKSDRDAENILEYVGDLNWKKKLTWYIPKNNSRSEYIKFLILRIELWKFKKSNPNIEEIFFGSYVNQYHLSLLGEFEKNCKIFLLYDGLQMISAAHFRKNGLSLLQGYPVLMRLLAFKKPELATLNYVSPVTLDLPDSDSLYLIKSSKSSGKRIPDSKVVFFIGQPISNKGVGVVNLNFYLKTLETLKMIHPDKEMIYVPHPRENQEILESISQIMRIKKLDIIFEKYFLNSDRLPGKIYSFYSSVLLNLIFLGTESEIISIKIPDSEMLGIYKEKIKPVYDYFQDISSEKFKLIEVKDIK